MINIILDNSTSRILGLDKNSMWKLRTSVCYFNMGAYVRTKNVYQSRVFLIDENGFFPTGLLKRVQEWLMMRNLFFSVIDNRIVPTKRKINLVNQLEEPVAYPEQLEASRLLYANGSGTATMPTGIGKTRTIKELLLLHQRPSLIITPSSNLKQQGLEYFTQCFGSKMVGTIDLNTPKPITITNYHSIESKDPKFFEAFDIVIFDEYHNAANNTIREINETHLSKIYYKYGLTATNFKNDDNAQILLECVLSNNLYTVSPQEAINKGYICNIVPIFTDLPNLNLKATGNYKTDFKVFIDDNAERNAIAVEQAKKMIQQNIPTIILVEHVQHGRNLQQMIPDAIFLNGQDESSAYNMQIIRKFNERKVPCIIGTSVIGEGVDTKAAGAIFNLSGGKAKSELLQKVGRVIRRFPEKKVGYYFDFIDNGQKHLIKHSKERISHIEETYGIQVKRV